MSRAGSRNAKEAVNKNLSSQPSNGGITPQKIDITKGSIDMNAIAAVGASEG